jgi:S1-C subfamily serine protease
VFVVKVDPNYAQPWQKCPQRSSSGSAFVLDTEQRIIITNAHVVGMQYYVILSVTLFLLLVGELFF